jgi:hypothetical protein
MSEIPDDIRYAAALAVGPWADPRGELVMRVGRAILAERQRRTETASIWRAQPNGEIHAKVRGKRLSIVPIGAGYVSCVNGTSIDNVLYPDAGTAAAAFSAILSPDTVEG